MKKNYLAILLLGFASTLAHAETFSVLQVSGNINGGTNSSHRIYSYGWIQSAYYLYAGTYVQAASYLYAGSYVYAGSYMQSPTGIFTNVLRSGGSNATGSLSAGLGAAANATSYSSVVVGRYNATTASDGGAATAGSWVSKDPLFVVGNGSGTAGDPDQFRNALTVYKDGTITMSKAQGDISMGQFAN